jgi:hypothetical protein
LRWNLGIPPEEGSGYELKKKKKKKTEIRQFTKQGVSEIVRKRIGVSGLVVKFIVAIDEPPVRFRADALFTLNSDII